MTQAWRRCAGRRAPTWSVLPRWVVHRTPGASYILPHLARAMLCAPLLHTTLLVAVSAGRGPRVPTQSVPSQAMYDLREAERARHHFVSGNGHGFAVTVLEGASAYKGVKANVYTSRYSWSISARDIPWYAWLVSRGSMEVRPYCVLHTWIKEVRDTDVIRVVSTPKTDVFVTSTDCSLRSFLDLFAKNTSSWPAFLGETTDVAVENSDVASSSSPLPNRPPSWKHQENAGAEGGGHVGPTCGSDEAQVEENGKELLMSLKVELEEIVQGCYADRRKKCI